MAWSKEKKREYQKQWLQRNPGYQKKRYEERYSRIASLNEILNKYIGARIREIRKELGLTKRELADKIPAAGVSRQYVDHVEKGIAGVSINNLYKFVLALNFQPCEIIPPLHTIKLALRKHRRENN